MWAAIRSCTQQKPGKQMFCFSFPLDQRAAREGVSKTRIKERIHQAGRWALFWGGGGRRRPPCWLRQMQAPGEEARGSCAFQTSAAAVGWGGGSRHRVKSSVGQPRAHACVPGRGWVHPWVCTGGRECCCRQTRFLKSPPTATPLNGRRVSHLPCKTSTPLQKWTFCRAASVVVSFSVPWKPRWGGFVLTCSNSAPAGRGSVHTGHFLKNTFISYGLPCWAERMLSTVRSVHVMIGSVLFSSSRLGCNAGHLS